MTTSASYRFDPCDISLVDTLRRELGCSETLAWVLARRGVDPDAARTLLESDPAREAAALHDPLLLGDMAAAVERIHYAIEQRERVVVHGDYDADGICATTLLVEGLEELGADVHAFLPERFANGYGLHTESIERFANEGVRLVIAVDCGITAVDAVERANELGVDVIICDHHRPADELPAAIIASARPSDYPFPDICATVVAGKLLLALGGPSGDRQHELEAIATIADCMPLIDENRVIVQRGLRALRSTTRPGLLALMNESGLRPREVDDEAVGFKIAPRLNATGRIAHPQLGYDVLRVDEFHATQLATQINEVNEQRRTITTSVAAEAIAQVEAWPAVRRDSRIYVVHGAGWHEGVVGIVASKLVEKYGRPVLVIADGEPARGSGRSVPHVDLHAALAACDSHLIRWGGHEQAAGVTVDPGRIEELQAALTSWACEHVTDDQLVPCDTVDAIVSGAELTLDLVHELDRLGPFGTSWERPRLLALGASITNATTVGDGTHLRGQLELDSYTVGAIGFGLAIHSMPLIAGAAKVDVALVPNINRFRGAESMQATLERIYEIRTEEWVLPGGWTHAHPGAIGTAMPTAAAVDAALAGLDIEQLSELRHTSLPSLDEFIDDPEVADIRSRAQSDIHVARLLSAGVSVLVVSSDAARRSELFNALLAPGRLTRSLAALLADERSAHHDISSHLAEFMSGDTQRFALTDYASLSVLIDLEMPLFDVVVVLDPPHSPAQLAILSQVEASLHILASDREYGFAADALASKQNVRATFGTTWKTLRASGPQPLADVLAALPGDAPFSPVPSAIVHGLRSLIARGMFQLDSDGNLEALDPTRAATTTAG